MEAPDSNLRPSTISFARAWALTVCAVLAFHLAYSFPACGFMIMVYLWCLVELTRLPTSRQASYFGLAVGLASFAPQMYFLWTIFGAASIALWFVLAFWIRMFLYLGYKCHQNFVPIGALALLPFLWTGLEYFRSELYYLRFSWLNVGYTFSSNLGWLPFNYVGVYGIGFLLMIIICAGQLLTRHVKIIFNVTALFVLAIVTNLPAPQESPSAASSGDVEVAGIQMEFPPEAEVPLALDKLIKKYPQAQLLVLSEYTFHGPVPDTIKAWCKKNQRYLIAGGEDPAQKGYYNTAFVVGPSGDIVFKQAKSVPIQFFADGMPALQQKLWASPWGNLGLCICYDLSYTRVTDELVRQGAQAIIVPTMDVADWGRHQHELHTRIAPMRAAEYGLPIFRLASSGISQCVSSTGRVLATAPMPGDEAMLSGTLHFGRTGTLPWDRHLALICSWVAGLFATWLVFSCLRAKKSPLPKPNLL